MEGRASYGGKGVAKEGEGEDGRGEMGWKDSQREEGKGRKRKEGNGMVCLDGKGHTVVKERREKGDVRKEKQLGVGRERSRVKDMHNTKGKQP